jgi:hypothetical protein
MLLLLLLIGEDLFHLAECLSNLVGDYVSSMHISLQRAAVKRRRVGVVIEAPHKNISHVVVDMKLGFFRRNSQLRIKVLVDKGELVDKLLPQFLVDLGHLGVDHLHHQVSAIGRVLRFSEHTRYLVGSSLKTSLPQSLFPRVEVNPQDGHLVVGDYQQFFGDVSQYGRVDLALVLHLEGLQD